jgi:hypothetical protein
LTRFDQVITNIANDSDESDTQRGFCTKLRTRYIRKLSKHAVFHLVRLR